MKELWISGTSYNSMSAHRNQEEATEKVNETFGTKYYLKTCLSDELLHLAIDGDDSEYALVVLNNEYKVPVEFLLPVEFTNMYYFADTNGAPLFLSKEDMLEGISVNSVISRTANAVQPTTAFNK